MADKKSWSVPGAHFGSDPEFFSAWTLFDIGPNSNESMDNLNTLMRIVTSRGQPLLAGVERYDAHDITDSLFGENLNGIQTVWCLKWIASGIGQMTEETLAKESDGSKMNINLSETLPLVPNVVTSGSDTNTFFIRHDSF